MVRLHEEFESRYCITARCSAGCISAGNRMQYNTEACHNIATVRMQSAYSMCSYRCFLTMAGLSMPSTAHVPCCADRNYSQNGSAASEGHGNHAQQPDIYTHSQQPQAYASGSLDGSQTKREGSVHSNHGCSEGYSGSLDGSNGAHVRQRGEGGSRGQVYRYVAIESCTMYFAVHACL